MTGGRATGTRTVRSVNSVNVLAVFVGAFLLIVARYGLPGVPKAALWYTVEGNGINVAVSGNGFTFTDLHVNAAALDVTVSGWYFTWFGPTLGLAALGLTLLANLATPLADVLRVLSFLVAALGLIATYYALAQLFHAQKVAGGSAHGVWQNASYGLWAALAGFAVLAVAGVVGPHRSRL